MKSMVMKELKLMVKEKGNLFYLILMPVLFIIIFGSIFNHTDSSITIHVKDEDRSAVSKALIKQLDKMKGFEVKTNNQQTENKQIAQIKSGKLTSLVVIPKGFGDTLKTGNGQANIHFYQDAASVSSTSPIEAVLQNVANQYREQKLVTTLIHEGNNKKEAEKILQPPMEIHSITENSKHVDMVSQIVPGYTVMFVFFIMISMVRRFFQEKESGMISRLRGTPMKSYEYLLGMWIPPFITVLVQCTVLLGFGYVFYHLHLGNIFAISLIVLCLAFCGTGIGLALSLISRSENQGIGYTQLISLGGAIVAGLWFPSDMLPKIAQTVGYFTPQYWALHGLQDIMVHNASIGDLWKSFLVLLLFGCIGFIIAIVRFKPFLKSASH
ncbi:ABC transporter permease [Bacillus ginsengihumi]|uniref:ABC transporter permease n=1 Tax=Heyndrickxia ginsengihumi TaxID=363870 RepID=A0A6M0P649_9BACI|nr:ABC transporter permease [Heyndrickxia ginsengihumi]MCM3022988.1 ABC transporter permease [Heyndrickxia ginsengihumi]NEY19459.1 ABC transporter permease [Heyndrickxia ginsengihumi]